MARLATADADGQPHVVPICYALIDGKVCFTIDQKPKRQAGRNLKRLANIQANPKAALVVDRYDKDWSKLGWVMIQGAAGLLASGKEHGLAQARLRERYPQLVAMHIARLPVVTIRIDRVMSWGQLNDL